MMTFAFILGLAAAPAAPAQAAVAPAAAAQAPRAQAASAPVARAQAASAQAPPAPAAPAQAASAQTASAPAKVEIVSVTGCLKETTPNNWTLVGATDPVPSRANAPPAKDIPSAVPAGKNEFKLIGVSEFNLPAHRDRGVIIKGLLIKATPTSRVNITSVTPVAPTCAPGAGKQ